MRKAYITGLAGPQLNDGERHLLAQTRPAGIILFARNCVSPDQIADLVADALDAIGTDDALVLIDQEGGRVRRLRPPQWRDLPAAAAYGHWFDKDGETASDAARAVAALTAADLRAMGINCNCAPVLDVPAPGSHDIIGDRAYGRSPAVVTALGRSVLRGYMSGGVVPVIKHIPGHGRARADSHLELPVVDTPKDELDWSDFAPFWALSEAPAAMSAHVVFTALDADHPASTSRRVIEGLIRSELGFEGLLMSDDLGMKALDGTMSARATAVIAAGSDLALHCGGDIDEMCDVAATVPTLAGKPLRRFERALEVTRHIEELDRPGAELALARALAFQAEFEAKGATA